MRERSLSTLAVACAASGVAFGAETGPVIGGEVAIIAPPESVVEEALESDETAVLFAERCGLVLVDEVTVDVSEAGTVSPVGGDMYAAGVLSPLTLSAGTVVDVWYAHVDSVSGDGGGSVIFDFTITFDRPILGYIITTASLDATHPALGAPGTAYANGKQLGSADVIVLAEDLQALTIHFENGGGTDQVRILVPATCPEDLDGDGFIGSGDLNILLGGFGAGDAGDIDGDGDTDSSDLNLLLAVFGQACA